MTDEGGQFYNMQLVLSETLLGRWNKLIDAWDIMLGKFASGNNVVGGTFKYMIDLVTDFVLALDKISPALLGIGASFGAKALLGGLSGKITAVAGLSGLKAQYAALTTETLKSYAVEQQRLVTEGQITQQIATQRVAKQAYNLADQQSLANAMAQRALQGNLTLLQMQRARAEGLITPELISQLEVMGLISAKQSELIMKDGLRARAQLAMQQAMGKVGGFFTWGNGLMLAAGAALGVFMKIKQTTAEIDERSKNLRQSAQQHSQSLSEALSANGNLNGRSTDEELSKANDELKEVLERSNAYTDTLKAQVEHASSLVEEYRLLKNAAEEAKNAASTEDKFSDVISEAMARSGGESSSFWGNSLFGFLDDNIQENTEDVLNAFNRMETALEGFDSATKQKMESVANEFLTPEEASLSLEEKLMRLAAKGGSTYDDFVRRVSKGNNDISYLLYKIQGRAENVNDGFKEIAEDDVPKIIETIANSLGVSKDDFTEWAQHNVDKVDAMFTAILRLCNVRVPPIVAKLRQIMFAALGMQDPQAKTTKTTPVWRLDRFLKPGGAGRHAYDKMVENGVVGSHVGGVTKYYQKEMAKYMTSLDAKDYETFGENVRKKYKAVRNENDARKAAGVAVNTREQEMLEAIAAANGISLDVGKNKGAGHSGKGAGRKDDAELRMWRERLDAAKKFYSTYKKYKEVYGPDKALDMTKGLFPDVSGMDVNDYEGSLQKIIDTLGDGWFQKSPERKKFLTSIKESILDYDLTEVGKRKAEEFSAAFNEALEQSISQYELYKSLFEKTGNKAFASQAFKDGAIWDDSSRSLAQQFKELTGEDVDIDATDTQAKHHLENIEGAYELWKKIVDLVKNKYKSSLNETADILSRNDTLAEKIATINDKYDQVIKDAQQRGDGSEVEVARRANISRRQEQNEAVYGLIPELKPLTERIWEASQKYAELIKYAEKIGDNTLLGQAKKAQGAAVNDEKFKDFRKVNDLDGMLANVETLTNKTIDWLAKEIDDWLKKENLSKEVADKLVDAQGKLGEYQANKGNIFAGAKNLSQGINIGKYLKGNLGAKASYQDATGATRYILSDSQAKKMGLTAGGAGYTRGQLKKAMETKTNSFENSVNKLASKFKALEQCLDPVVDLFSALGMEDTALGQGTSMVSGALGAASSVSSGLGALGLESLGPYGAAAGAALSITASLFAMHDKQLQKEIDASKEKQKAEEYLYQNIQDVLDSTLGGVYNFTMSDSLKETLSSIKKRGETLDAIKTKYGEDSSAYKVAKRSTYYDTETTVKHATQAMNDPSNAYMAQLASLEAQRDELKHQRDLESKKKKSDSSALLEYDQQIIEAEQAIETYTAEFLNTIYGIDFKSWAKELTTAIVDAWAAGEDAADAYGDKVKAIMKDLAINILSQKYIETALDKSGVMDILQKDLESSGKLNEQHIKTIGDTLKSVSEGAIDNITSVLDYLKEAGYDFSENSSSSSSKSIKSITEVTADLLASYINAIRADVSVNRQNVQFIADSVKVLPKISTIASAQLVQLTQLVSLAQTRNGRLDEMYDWMRGVTNGTKKLYIA